MNPIKLLWGFRALIYKPFFKKIGVPSYIGKPCFIEGKTRITIGKRVRIFPGVRMEAKETGTITIGNNTAIEQNVHITSSGSELIIGKDVAIFANTFITNIDHKYDNINCSVLEQGIDEKITTIGDGCMIGASAAIMAGTKLGRHCIVGTGTAVKGEYPDYCVIVGNPGRIVKRYDNKTKEWKRVSQ